ncbi:hypothetical protein MKW92_020848 [Papaver armeniacum]|nr:hypothetical protein MKW92_020848 [Papaver armeniacum]
MCFENFVDNVLILRNHKSDINKFCLSWYLEHHLETDTIRNHLNTWITAALNRNVVILSVDISGMFDSKSEIVRHQFPSKLFNCPTLTELELNNLKNIVRSISQIKITFPKSMDLTCLRVLKLKSLVIDNANSLFLESNCPPVLAYLSIKGCKISIDNCSGMELWIGSISKNQVKCSESQTFRLRRLYMSWHEYSMVNISSLVCARIEMLDFTSQGDSEQYMKLPEHEKELCATRAMNFLNGLEIVNELQLSPGILENLFSRNTIPNEDLTKHRISYSGNTKCAHDTGNN